jgi:hypothetical protein
MDELQGLSASCPALAQFLATPCEGAPDAAWQALVAHVERIPEGSREAVLAIVARVLDRNYEAARGFRVEPEVRVAPLHWLTPWPSPALQLVRELVIEQEPVPEPLRIARDVAGRPILVLSEIGVGSGAAAVSAVLRLAREPWLGNVRGLVIHGVTLGAENLDALLRSPLCASLIRLALPGCAIDGAAGARVLARWAGAARLEMLNLSHCYIQGEGLDALLDAPMPALWRLELGTNCVYDDDEPPPGYWDRVNARCKERDLEIVLT